MRLAHAITSRAMNDQPRPDLPAKTAPALLSKESLVALAAGLLMGQVVSGIAVHHDGSLLGLTLALVYVLAGSASLMMFLLSWPGRPVARKSPGVLHAWLLVQGVGVLVSLQAQALL